MTSLFRSKIVVATALLLVLALLPLFGGATLAEAQQALLKRASPRQSGQRE